MLTPMIDRYLELRRALGYKLETTEYLLRSFARFADECLDTHIAGQTALAWAKRAATVRQRDKRLRIIVGLARFMHAEDPRHEIPARETAVPIPTRPTPYIFSWQEIQRLSQAAARLGPSGSLRPLTFNTLYSLLAVTGLRISEALALRIEDFGPDGLVIRETKFHKSRLIPLHETTHAALRRYLDKRQRIASPSDRIFISLRGTPLCYETAYRMFRQLCIQAGVHGAPPMPRPRIHDLRHTAAVRALEDCPNARDQVTPHMLALSTYLGHASLRGTYWYLHSSPQLMQDIAGASEAWVIGGNA
jgi:integrase/recombinase XerD